MTAVIFNGVIGKTASEMPCRDGATLHEQDSTVATVVEGRIAVEPSPMQDKHATNSSQNHPQSPLQLGPDQQLRVTQGEWPATAQAVDAQRTTSWLRRELVFDHEPLVRVAAEYNRYAPKPNRDHDARAQKS